MVSSDCPNLIRNKSKRKRGIHRALLQQYILIERNLVKNGKGGTRQNYSSILLEGKQTYTFGDRSLSPGFTQLVD